jgi:isopentenyldiphosphate isomerase
MARSEPDGVAQDPSELFDVVFANGMLTGKVKTRAEVHREGDWHRSAHVWVAGESDSGRFLLLQRRSFQKDTWPGRLDATVGGHYRHGEGFAEALREVEEEIGVAVNQGDLRRLGVRLCASEVEPEILDREIQDLFLLRDDRPLIEYSPNPDELDALIAVGINDMLALFSDETDEIPAESLRTGERLTSTILIDRDDFIPTLDNYFYRIAIAANRALAGEQHVVV